MAEHLGRYETEAVTNGMNEALAGIEERIETFVISANRLILAKSDW